MSLEQYFIEKYNFKIFFLIFEMNPLIKNAMFSKTYEIVFEQFEVQ